MSHIIQGLLQCLICDTIQDSRLQIPVPTVSGSDQETI